MKAAMTPSQRVKRVKEIQELFYAAQMPPQLLDSIKLHIQTQLPSVKKLKFRSSANAEDLPGFDGAGLYDSFSAKVDKKDKEDNHCSRVDDGTEEGEVKSDMSPPSVQCAIKGVYASLWNVRAIEERTFARLNHTSANMALAVLVAYKELGEITDNAVVVTMSNSAVAGYTLSILNGNNVVTNPTPGTLAENVLAVMGEEGGTQAIIYMYLTLSI